MNLTSLRRRPHALSALVMEIVRHGWKGLILKSPGSADMLEATLRVGALSGFELDFLGAARKEMAPSCGLIEYCRQVLEARRLNAAMPAVRVSEDEYGACLRDPDEDWKRRPLVPAVFRAEFIGFDKLDAALKDGTRVLLLAWHNGAQTHTFLRDLRKRVPALEAFSAYRELFMPSEPDGERFFTTPLLENPGLGMLRMAKCMEAGRVALHYFDGVAGKRDMMRRLFGCPQYFGKGFIHLARECDAAVMPMTAYFAGRDWIRVFLGEDLFSRTERRTLRDDEMLEKTLRYFLEDLKQHGPAQLQVYPADPLAPLPS